MAEDLSRPKNYLLQAYVTNLGKYNEGDLVGEWVSFPVSEEELNECFMDSLH